MTEPYRVTNRMRYVDPAGPNRYGARTCWQWCEADAERIRSTGRQAEARLLEGECWVERIDWEPLPSAAYDRRDEHIKSVVAALERGAPGEGGGEGDRLLRLPG